MKKPVCFLFLMSLLLLLSGCGSQSTTETEKVTLTALQYELENQTLDFDNMWYFQQIEEQTGVHVDFDVVKHSDWSNRVSLMFASGKYHDMLLRGDLDIEEYGVSEGIILSLDDYLAEYMPNYFSRLTVDGADTKLKASDGKMYYVGFLLSQGINTNGHFFINKTWLDKLGLDVPTTTDELTEVLRAFKNSDPNGNGENDEIPYEATFDDVNTGIYNAFSAFGVPMNEAFVHLADDGHVLFAPEEDGFRQCLEWLHELCVEGLLDIESLTQGSNLWAAKVNQQKAGYFSYWRLQNTALNADIIDEYVVMLPVSAPNTQVKLARAADIVEIGAALTSQNTNIEASLRWVDAQLETENMLVAQNGKLGDTLIKCEDGRYEVSYVPSSNELYKTVPVICGQFFAPESYYTSVYVPAAHRQEKSAYCQLYDEAGVLETLSYTLLNNTAPKTSEESARILQIHTPMKSSINAYLVEAITRGVTDENYQAFLEELKSIGSEEYVTIYQTVYDRYVEANTQP